MYSLEEVANRLAIREVIELYSVSVTKRDWETLASCFHPQARWHASVGYEFHTRDGVRDGVRATVETRDILVQMTHSVVITELTPERAKATVVLNEIGRGKDGSVFVLGLYYDTLVKSDGRWMFEERDFHVHYLDVSPLAGRILVNHAVQA